MKRTLLSLLIALGWAGAVAQIPAPQINLTGNIGCQGFPCVNTGTLVMASDANRTLTAQETSAFSIKVTSSVTLTATRNLIFPAGRFPVDVENATTGGQSIQVIGASGTGVTIANGQTVRVWNDGTNFVQVGPSGGGTGTVTHTGALTATHVMTGNGSADSKVDTGCTTDGAGNVTCASYTANGPNPAGGTAGGTAYGAGTAGGSPPTGTVVRVGPASVSSAYTLADPGAPPSGTQHEDCTLSGVNVTCAWASGGASGFPITLGSTSVAASSTTTALAGLALTTSSINGVTLSTTAGSGNFLNGTGGYSSAGGISVKIKYVSVEGCPQDTDLTAGGGTDATACINALFAGAGPTNPILVVQDGASLISGNGIYLPAGGGAFIQGNGGGIATVNITNCSLTSNVATFTTQPNTLITGQHVQVADLGTCSALNNEVLQVISTGLSSTQFEANFTHADIASGAETGTGVTVYGTGFFMAVNSGVSGNMISNGFPLVGTNCDIGEATVPARGANFGISNMVLNGSSGEDYCSSIAIGNANDILVDNVVFYRPQAHSIWLTNTGQVVLRANKVYVTLGDPLGGTESDGFHIEGPDNDLVMTGNYFNTTDDAIALNAREGYCGPITRVAIAASTVEHSLHMLRAYTNIDACANGLVPKQSSITIDGFSGNANSGIADFGFDAIPTLTDALTDFKWSNSVLNAEGQAAFVITENVGRMDFDNVTVKGAGGCVFCSGIGNESIALLKLHDFSVVGTAASGGFPGMLYAIAGGGTLTATDLIVDGLGYYNDAGGAYAADCPFCTGAVTNLYAANIDMNLFNTFADSHVTKIEGQAGPTLWTNSTAAQYTTVYANNGFVFTPLSGAGGAHTWFNDTSSNHYGFIYTDNSNLWAAFGGQFDSGGTPHAEPVFLSSGTLNFNRYPGFNGPVFGSVGDWTWYHAASGTASADCIHMAAQAFGAGGYSDVLVPCADWSVRTKNNTLDDGSGNASIAGSTALTGGISTNVPIGACGGTNCQIDFGTNYGALDIVMYDGGAAQRYGWGLTAGTMNFVVPSLANSGGHVVFTDGGDLGAGSSMFTITRAASSVPVEFDAPIYGAGALANGMTATTQAVGTNNTAVATGQFVLANRGTHNYSVTVQPGLFATSAMLGQVFYEPVAASLNTVTVRVEGAISCSVAPTVNLLDLGTTATTAYGSATVISSNPTTLTSDGVYTSGASLGVALAAGHYFGFGLGAGTCATAPTLDISAQVQ